MDDLVTLAEDRGRGHGAEIVRWLAARAREEGLPQIDLDSRATARDFYERIGFPFLTAIPCWMETRAD